MPLVPRRTVVERNPADAHSLARAVIVKASSGPRYVVGCRSAVPKHKLKNGIRVSLDMTTLTIMRCVALRVPPVLPSRQPGRTHRADLGPPRLAASCRQRSTRSCTT